MLNAPGRSIESSEEPMTLLGREWNSDRIDASSIGGAQQASSLPVIPLRC